MVNFDEYSVPIFQAGTGKQQVRFCNYEGEPEWPGPKFPEAQAAGGSILLPRPLSLVRPSGPADTEADGHLVLYQPETARAYDFWNATTERSAPCVSRGGGRSGRTIFAAGAVDFFDVRGPGNNPDSFSSARATGTSLLAGLILPEDIERGAISHALAFAILAPRNTSRDPETPRAGEDYFYPASTTETDYFNRNPKMLAAGQRIRLRPVIVDEDGVRIDENRLAPITRMVLETLRTYGAYLVDSASGFVVSAEDIHTARLNLSIARVNMLAGRPARAGLPAGMTKWHVLMERLDQDLQQIPIAYGPWEDGQDPARAQIRVVNFEVVELAARP